MRNGPVRTSWDHRLAPLVQVVQKESPNFRLKRWRFLTAMVLAVLMALPGVALAKQGPPTTELTNNLSVPAIFVPSPGTFAVTCGTAGALLSAVDPTGMPLTGFELPGYYYVQGVNTWQAQCITAAAGTISADVDWGDNLEGTALKAGTPIRVEVGLTDDTVTGMLGYHVVKLQPSLSDKDSKYGTLATPQGTDPETYQATQESFPYTDPVTGAVDYVRVYDLGARFSLYNETTGTYVVPDNTPMSAEINATGKVVYGFNWGASGKGVKTLPTAGTYILTFYAPNVTLSGTTDGHTATLTFVVAPKSSGGGRTR